MVDRSAARSAVEPSRSFRSAGVALAAAVVLCAAPLVAERFALARAGGNVLVGADVRTTSTMGLVENMLRGPLPPEGTWLRSPHTVRFAAGSGTIEFDFEKPMMLAALVLQAPPDDRYVVETSRDHGATWQPVWAAEPVEGSNGRKNSVFRNRQTRFEPPLEATRLRIRNDSAYGIVSAISALRAYSDLPDGWPSLAQLQSPSLRARHPWTLDFDEIYRAKFVVALVATPLLLLCAPAFRRRFSKRADRWLKRAAIVASLVAGLGWWNLMQLPFHFDNHWDAYHHYMAGKYAPELGYTGLYACYLAADVEDGFATNQLRRHNLRNLATHGFQYTSRAITKSPRTCRVHFSEERWAEWKKDHAFFRERMQSWILLPTDNGFNGSPAWLIAGRSLASLAPISDATFHLLISVDTLLLVGMWYVVWCSFGWRVTCLGIVFWGTNVLAGNFLLGSYLRQDVLFLTITGICWARQRRMFLAGASLAYATMLRLFPAFVLLGLLIKIACEMVEARTLRPSRAHWQLVAGVLVATLLIGGISVVASGRTTAWWDFARNTRQLGASDKPQQVGLASFLELVERQLGERTLASNAGEDRGNRIPEERERPPNPDSSRMPVLWIQVGAIALLLPLLVAAISRQKEWVAGVLGIGLIPLAGDLTSYYFAILLAFAFLAVRSELAAVGFAVLSLLLSGLCLRFRLFGPEDGSDLYRIGSAIVIAHTFWITGLLAFGPRRQPAADGYRAAERDGPAVSARIDR